MNSRIKQLSVVGASGLLFGIGLAISGMADPAKVIGFLDITGPWDPSLIFVMGGALFVFVPAYLLIIKPRTHSLFGGEIPTCSNQVIDKNLLIGSAIFGVGWGALGVCPGPAFASLLSGNHQVLLFIAAMIVGSLLGKKLTMTGDGKN